MESRVLQKDPRECLVYKALRPRADQFKRRASEQEVSEPQKLVRQATEELAKEIAIKVLDKQTMSRAALKQMANSIQAAIDLIMTDLFPMSTR